jgi:hypothetical protein
MGRVGWKIAFLQPTRKLASQAGRTQRAARKKHS